MEFENSSLFREVQAVIADGVKPIAFTLRAQIHIGDQDYNVYKVLSVDDIRDYEANFAAVVILEVQMPGGMYAYDVYPNQDKIEITLSRYPLLEGSEVQDSEALVKTERFTAVLIDKGNPVIENNSMNPPSRETLDLTRIEDVQFQLISKTIEQMRLVSVGGRYRNVTGEEVIKTVLTANSQVIDVTDEDKIQGVDMVKASNQEKRSYIIINDGTPLVKIPQYVQERCGGVYSAGMGHFFQDNRWYIYPCYDTKRYEDSDDTLTVINIPRTKFMDIERTYRMDGDHPVIIATGEVRFRDDSTSQQLNGGNGVRFADANKFMNKFVKTEGNKSVAARAENNSEFISVKRPNGNNNVRMSSTGITANPYLEFSKLARRNGGVFAFVWENSNPDLLKPGMMMKIMYLQEDEIVTTYGVVLKAQHYHHMRGVALTSTGYRTNTVISVFINRPIEE